MSGDQLNLDLIEELATENSGSPMMVLPETLLALVAEVRRVREREARVWDEGYEAAYEMARGWGHVDYWENYPDNPYQ